MDKKPISIKRVIILAGALCAYWIGSGFATGQEVLQFFAAHGTKGIVAAFVFLFLMIPLTYILYGVGQKQKFPNPYDVFEYYCGTVIGKVYVWYSVVLVYAIFVVMLAGGGATINQYYGLPTYIGTGAIAILALGTTLLGAEKLVDIIGVIGPIKIVFVAIIGICGIITLFGQPTLLSDVTKLLPTLGFKSASSNWAWSGALYAFLALMVSIPFQVNCGASAGSLKEARTAAFVGTVAMTAAIIALVIGELVYYKLIVGQQVPTLAIAKHISPILGLIFSVLIVLSIYSAVASFLLMVVRKFATDKTKKFNIIATVLTVIGMFFGGVLPFDKLVNILYPLAGYSAIVFAGFMIYKELSLRNRKANVEKENN
ncbi:YkvI family membrane protein [Clostridium estertheticum]|uniref:YkvI family membrane protein n=1 Tax=Clostridium estertheticum TaxID=238834 RepID=UPI001C0E59AB|nr:hypothetical protein [Clostridium estertheticum]MBU3074483.1 hypothetical protein [Clostridium estertheticum]MBU3165947.1 hypothetical protein [Clostridium estertheticum]